MCVSYMSNNHCLLWVDPSRQLSPTQPLARSPHSGMEERIRRVTVRTLVGWDKDSLIGKAKATRAGKAKEGILSRLPIGRHSACSRRAGLHQAQWLLGKNTTIAASVTSSSFSPPPAFISEHDILWHGVPLSSVWVNCHSCVRFQTLVHPQPTPRWGRAGERKGWVLCKRCLAIAKTLVC